MTVLRKMFLLGVVLTTVAIATGVVSSSAHEGEGEFAVESAQVRPEGVRYTVRLTWTNDGHPALDATVTATAIAPDGTAQTPVGLSPSDQDGRYAGLVPLPAPGRWTVRFTSVTPAGTLEVNEQVARPTTTTAPPTTTAPADPGPTPTATSVGASPTTNAPSDEGDEDGGSSASVVFFGVVLILVGGVVLIVWRQRRRS